MNDDALTVVVHRRVREGADAAFRAAMREFVEATQRVPGHKGMELLLPASGGREYTVVSRFASQQARDAFTDSADYRQWMERLAALTEGDPRINELTGLEGWFPSAGVRPLPPIPRYRMAIATLLGVYPVTMALAWILDPVTARLPALLRDLVFSVLVVVLLTWVVMPAINRVLHRWLFGLAK